MFAWCQDGQHSLCKGDYQRFTYERNKVVWLDEYVECGCKCHKKKTPRAQPQPSPES